MELTRLYYNLFPVRCSYDFALVVRTLLVRCSYEFASLFVRCSYERELTRELRDAPVCLPRGTRRRGVLLVGSLDEEPREDFDDIAATILKVPPRFISGHLLHRIHDGRNRRASALLTFPDQERLHRRERVLDGIHVVEL